MPTIEHDGEAAIIAAVQGGDRAAFSQLVRQHQRRAYAVCRAILANHEDAEDAMQDGFLNAFRAIDTFKVNQPFGAWLHRIMANASRDVRRRRLARPTEELMDTVASSGADVADQVAFGEALERGLAKLTDRQRSVLVLHDVEGFSHVEIGHILGIPEGTAKYDLHVARKAMRAGLS